MSSAKSRSPKNSPYNTTPVGKAAIATGIEAGYDIFSQINYFRNRVEKIYVFGRYEYYNSYIKDDSQPSYEYTKRQRIVAGLNYLPIPQIAIKAEYSNRIFESPFNNEPSINVGIAYEGFFM